MPERYDIHDRRHQLKQIRDTGDTALYENRDGLECPACGRVYDSLFATEERTNSFDPDDAFPFCLVREPERVLVFTH